MKIICTCGNEVNLIEPKDNEDRLEISDEGIYVTQDDSFKFDFWEQHDTIGIVCRECKRAVWMFT